MRSCSPLAAKREHIGNFINEAAVTASATAERRADLEAQFQKLPGFLRELRATMIELNDFNLASTPVLSDLSDAAPDLTRINTALGPFADAGTVSFKSLGKAAEEAGPDLVASQPVLKDVEQLANNLGPVAKNLAKLLGSLRERGGYRNLTRLIYNLGGAINGFDSYGHFLRAALPVNNCVNYENISHEAGCTSTFEAQPDKAKNPATDTLAQLLAKLAAGDAEPKSEGKADPVRDVIQEELEVPFLDIGGEPDPEPEPEPDPEPEPETEPDASDSQPSTASKRSTRMLLDFLVGPQSASPKGGGR